MATQHEAGNTYFSGWTYGPTLEVANVGAMGQSFHWARFDERTFVVVPNVEWSRTKVFEIDASGNASPRFESTGWAGEWLRVR